MIALLLIALTALQTQNVEVEPVTCWWRTTTPSVHVGERFTVVLTCSLLQTDAARVIADESRLEPSVVQLPPFEVVDGARARDLTTAGRRFVQFEYHLQMIAENVFASDVALPPLELTYRVESRAASGDSLAGRDRTYALPPLTIRVLSLVPDTADDIREAPVATFAEIEQSASYGAGWRVAGAVLVMLGALVLALALAGMLRSRRVSRVLVRRTLSDTVILRGAQRELSAVRDAVRSSGWTADLAGRALAAVRVVVAHATGHAVAQRFMSAESAQTASGELIVVGRSGARAFVSSAVVTAEDDDLRDALTRLSTARYDRQSTFDAQLDVALDVVLSRVESLIAERPWREKLWAR